jgi:hypothetical protein
MYDADVLARVECLDAALSALLEGASEADVCSELIYLRLRPYAKFPRPEPPPTEESGAQAPDEDLASHLRACTLKWQAVEILFHHRISADDPRSTNAIVQVLVGELAAQHNIKYDRSAAYRVVKRLLKR